MCKRVVYKQKWSGVEYIEEGTETTSVWVLSHKTHSIKKSSMQILAEKVAGVESPQN